jgi:hypothetical protein
MKLESLEAMKLGSKVDSTSQQLDSKAVVS